MVWPPNGSPTSWLAGQPQGNKKNYFLVVPKPTLKTKSAEDRKNLKKGVNTSLPPNPVNEQIVPANKTVTHINKK